MQRCHDPYLWLDRWACDNGGYGAAKEPIRDRREGHVIGVNQWRRFIELNSTFQEFSRLAAILWGSLTDQRGIFLSFFFFFFGSVRDIWWS